MNTYQKILLIAGLFFFFYIINKLLYKSLKSSEKISKEIEDVLTRPEHKVKGRFE